MNDSLSKLQQAELGQHETIKLHNRDEVVLASMRLVSQAKRTLDITSRDLDPEIYDNDEFVTAVKNLATRSRLSKIRILIQDSSKIVNHGHKLIDLAHRLSSFIEIRLQGKHFNEYNEAWLIVDESAWLRRPVSDRFEGECDFYTPRLIQERLIAFNEMWTAGEPDPNLRRLHL